MIQACPNPHDDRSAFPLVRGRFVGLAGLEPAALSLLVSRRSDGKIHVDDDFHETRKGAVWGAVGGAVVGLIFPPALLASAAVGAGVGAGVGGLEGCAKSDMACELRVRVRGSVW